MIVLGLDPAIGGGNGLVACSLGEQLTILDAQADYNFNKTEQIFEVIETFARQYKPSLVIVEFDAQQKGIGNDDRLADMGRRYGFKVVPHITRGTKADEVFGVASMDQSFRKGEIRIPWGSPQTEMRMTPLVHQIKAWRPDIATKNLTQDLVMALWFVWRHWMKTRRVIVQEPVPAWRPSFLVVERRSA